MGTSAFDYILATPTTASPSCELEGFSLYLEHFEGFATEAHHHEEIQIILPLAGRMHLYADGEDHLMGPEWACLIPPNVRHGFTCLDGTQTFLALFAPGDWLERLAAGLERAPFSARGLVVARDVNLWLQGQQMAAELRAPQLGQRRALSMSMEQLGIYFLRSLTTTRPEPQALPEPRVLRAVELILNRFSEELTVEELARDLAMSPRHFERCFKQAVGTSPKRFLIEVRLRAGKEMLSKTDRSIADIAMDVGFKNPSHFSEAFQKLTGVTPSAFRQGGRDAR